MGFEECVKFANEVGVCFLATCQGGQPRVRPMRMWFADSTGFYFQTQTVKALWKQLKENPKVELCFLRPTDNLVLRVYGEVEFLEDLELKKRCLMERPFLKQMGIEDPSSPILGLFRVSRGEAYFWTMKDSMKEDQIPRIRFDK